MGIATTFASILSGAHAPIFIHSSFRTSSTWIWSKFRADPAVTAYYECFHERLQFISATEIKEWDPSVWGSGHPDIEPYFLEYLPLLRKEGGVAGFDQSMAFEQFFPAHGYNGSLSRAEKAYIKRLIARAARLRRTPCLSCKRSLGRTRALKRAIGGTHIVLQRKLLQQWRSYREQARLGNSFFLNTILSTIAVNQHEPFIAFLGDFVRNQPGGTGDIASSHLDEDDLFAVFVAFHFYLYLLTSDDSDLVIRTSELSDPDYRRATGDQLGNCTGLTIDFSDAREWNVVPGDLLRNVEKARRRIEEFCDRARRSANKSVAQAEAFWPLLKDLYEFA
jgi:hypothetical protein